MKIRYSIAMLIMLILCTSERPPHEDIIKANSFDEIDVLRVQDNLNAETLRCKEDEIIRSQNKVLAIIYKKK